MPRMDGGSPGRLLLDSGGPTNGLATLHRPEQAYQEGHMQLVSFKYLVGNHFEREGASHQRRWHLALRDMSPGENMEQGKGDSQVKIGERG